MKVSIKQHLGCIWSVEKQCYLHMYVFEAENGIIVQDADECLLEVGSVFDLPDEAWQVDSYIYDVCCDTCGAHYDVKTQAGLTVMCPVCGAQETIPEGVEGRDGDY